MYGPPGTSPFMNEFAGVQRPFHSSDSTRYQNPSGVTLGTLGAWVTDPTGAGAQMVGTVLWREISRDSRFVRFAVAD